jgi:hypothetical protein
VGINLLPFKLLWALIGILFGLLGRLITACLGIALMFVGIILTVTVVGAAFGVLFFIFGLLLLIKSVF